MSLKEIAGQNLPRWFVRAWPVAGLAEVIGRRSTLAMAVGVFLLSAIAWKPLLAPVYPVTWDGDLHVIRVLHLEKELRAGQFPVRWGSEQNGGYGYPTFNFYYQFPYYAGAALHQLGLPVASAIKLLIGLSLVSGGLLMAFWVRSMWGPLGGFVAGTLFVLSPALLQATYLILAVGELVVMGVLPGILWALHGAATRDRCRLLLFWAAGLLLAIAVLSHNLLGIFALGTAGLYGLWLAVIHRSWWPLAGTLGALGLALGLTAYFWLPGLHELQYTASAVPLQIRFNPPLELLDISPTLPREDRGVIQLAYTREMMGPPVLGAIVLAGMAYVALRDRLSRWQRGHLIFGLILTVGTIILLVMPFRREVWQALPLLKHAQYASRLLLLLAFFGAALGGAVIAWSRWRVPVVIVLVGLAVLYGYAFARPAMTEPVQDGYFRSYWHQMLGPADWGTPIMPRWAALENYFPTKQVATLEGRGEVLEQRKRSTHIAVTVRLEEPAIVRFTTLYFPGWQATVDGRPATIDIASRAGTIGVAVPAGEHRVTLQFTDTPVRTIGNTITLGSAALAVVAGAAFTALSVGRRRWPMVQQP